MKESITKFDLEAAFKALDEIDIPVAGKVKANRPALTEIFSRKTKFDSLMEEYYDISNTAELDDAKEAREAEVAKAKLERIEKIVDLDADSPEDLLTSYVGKYIIQCPQCMTLFYKDQEDVVEAEDDPNTVNVNEVCQHCGNESGYTLIGKVGEAEPDEFDETAPELELPSEEIPEEPAEEEPASEEGEELEDLGDLDAIDLDLDLDNEEEKKEESFIAHTGETLVEEFADDTDLDAKLEAHSEYIEYLRTAIAQEEEKLEKATNEQVKIAIQRNIDAFKADLESALPDAVKNDIAVSEDSIEETPVEEESSEEAPEAQEESYITASESDTLTESLHEEADLEVSSEEFEELIKSPEFQKSISDAEVRAIMNDEKEEEIPVEESKLEENVFDKLKLTRAGKADWILANTLEDYNNIKANAKGELVPDETNQRFNTFVVICYTNKDSKGKLISVAPSFNNKDLVVGKNGKAVQEKPNYKEADKLAKGWSMQQGNGPAFIYLAKDREDEKAVFLCQYFKGELKNDQLDKYFKIAKDHLKGAKLMAKSGGFADDESDETTESTDESLNTIMASMEELQESTLETLISDSLVEAYGNVAGFRLTECSFADNKFTVDGTIYFTSGNTRKTTYAFNESAKSPEGKISLQGINEKLGLDKQFTLTGRIENKTLITESFKRNK